MYIRYHLIRKIATIYTYIESQKNFLIFDYSQIKHKKNNFVNKKGSKITTKFIFECQLFFVHHY